MKSIKDMQSEMSDLYDQLKEGKVELKMAAEMANIAGKFFKAEALIFAREVFMAERRHLPPSVTEELTAAGFEVLPVLPVQGKKGNAVAHTK